MKETLVKKAYEVAKERYAEIGIDTEKILEQLQNFHLSMHCWQADDVKGFETQIKNKRHHTVSFVFWSRWNIRRRAKQDSNQRMREATSTSSFGQN